MKAFLIFICFTGIVFSKELFNDDLIVLSEKLHGFKSKKRIEFFQKEFIKIKKEKEKIFKIIKVNGLVNKLQHKEDISHWKKDYDSTLADMVISGAGDSKDFALAKYFLLVKLGFDKKNFHLVSSINKEDYINLAYCKNSNKKRCIILDHRENDINLLKEQSKIKFLPNDIRSVNLESMEELRYKEVKF